MPGSNRTQKRRVALACLGACAGLFALAAHAESMREVWNHPTTPFQVIGNIHYVGTQGLGVYLITTPRGHFLVDGGLEESAKLIADNIEALGFKLTDIKFLLNTHAHFDHSGGLAELKRRTGATLVASAGDKSALEGGFYLGSESDHTLDAPKVAVDRTIGDHESLSLGGTKLTANLTPGHTRGCTSWSMQVRDGAARYRVLFFCSTTVALNRLVGPPQYDGIVADYEHSFTKLKRMKVDVFLAPHAEFFGMQQKRDRLATAGARNPFVDPAEFETFVAKSETDFHEQLAKQRTKLEAEHPPVVK